MRCCSLFAAVPLMLAGSLSASASDESCTDESPLQTQPASNLLQARRNYEPVPSAFVITRAGYIEAADGQLQVRPNGASAPLDEAGYAAVADGCCQSEMMLFIKRQIMELDMEICVPAGLFGFVPYHSCGKGPQSFAALTSDLLKDSTGPCPWLAADGQCGPMKPSCPSFPGLPPAADCGCSKAKAVPLDFKNSKVLYSNLGGKGPDASKPEEIRFGNIGEYPPGKPFDLVIATSDAYLTNQGVNGLRGPFGNITLNAAGNPANFSGKIHLQFKIVRPKGYTLVVLPEFFFTFVDIDAPPSLTVKETVSGKGYKGYVLDANSDLAVSKDVDGSTKFSATRHDSPTIEDPMNPTLSQRKSMVMYFYDDTAEFNLTISIPSNITPNNHARSFMFSGESALIDRCDNATIPSTTTLLPATTPAPQKPK